MGKGIGLVLVGHVAICVAAAIVDGVGMGGAGWLPAFVAGLLGACQLVYVVPLAVRFAARGEVRTRSGVVLAALVTALVNGSCWVVMFDDTLPHHAWNDSDATKVILLIDIRLPERLERGLKASVTQLARDQQYYATVFPQLHGDVS